MLRTTSLVSQRKFTLRITMSESDGTTQPCRILRSAQNDITSSTYSMLTRVHTWPAFSNHTVGDGGSTSNSLEAIHDGIHGAVGGQMSDPAVAGQSHYPFIIDVHPEITVLHVKYSF